MSIHPRAGKPASPYDLIDVAALERAFYERLPDPRDPAQRVAFGTSGHRGSALSASFNAAHIHAIVQAICEYRVAQGFDGPLFLGKDTHALSRPAERAALEVFSGNGVRVLIQSDDGYTPTPAISHAIVAAKRARREARETLDPLAPRRLRGERREIVDQREREAAEGVQRAELASRGVGQGALVLLVVCVRVVGELRGEALEPVSPAIGVTAVSCVWSKRRPTCWRWSSRPVTRACISC